MKTTLSFFVVVATALAQSPFDGAWIARVYDIDPPRLARIRMKVDGEKLAVSTRGGQATGRVTGARFEFEADKRRVAGVLENGELRGEVTFDGASSKWIATRAPAKSAPRTHDFEPSQFHLYFSSSIKPVLTLQPGDTVRTWSVDAGGVDKNAKRRSGGGNPQTGPFYIERALPGDTLVVRLNRVQVNRDWAGSGNSVMRNALEPGSLGNLKWDNSFSSRWRVDRERNVAFLDKPTDRLKDLRIPLSPMLGCVAVAPQGEWSIRTTDSGRFGGNMDYNQIREGTTVYLPVSHPGALLFLGDGHAAQGDGELTGDAIEISMDFEFTVDLIEDRNFGHPLAENADYLISIGIAGSLDQALQMATSGMMRWLDRDYGLTPNESAIVLGFAVKYDVVDLVGTQVSVAAKLPKSVLAQLPRK